MKIFIALIFAFFSFLAFSQEKILDYNLNESIPKDTTVVRGTFKNGLKYYIKKNDRPKKTVEMRLIVKVGSLQEEEDQLGVAHILEHMLFNGTKNFPKHKLTEYLEGIGLKFGADLNAHTGFDETVYKLSIPTEDIKQMDTGFQILEDWAHNALLEEGEIEAERGVVMEEYRLRQKGINERIYSKILSEMYAGTRESKRLPIGTEESILNFKPERLRDFYKTWYRPNLMSVVISGDIDEDYAKKKIEEHFSELSNPSEEKPLIEFPALAVSNEKKIVVISDPELTSSSVSLSFIDKEKDKVDGAKIKEEFEGIVTNLLNEMLNARFQELGYKKEAPFLGARSYRTRSIVVNQRSYGVGASSAENKTQEAVKGLFTELERAKRYGFTITELENAKKNVLASNETMLSRKDERYSKNFTKKLISEYKGNWALNSVDWKYDFVKKIIPTIDLKTVEKQFINYYHIYNQNILVLMPQKEGVIVPTEKEILQLVNTSEEDTSILAYENTELSSTLIKDIKHKGEVVSEEKFNYNIKKFTLSNGVDVFYKKTDFDTDFVSFKSFSYGGTSLLSNEKKKTIGVVKNYITSTGIGGFKPYELKKVLSGKKVKVRTHVGVYDEGLKGDSKRVDMETLFQLIYLNFIGPNKDKETYNLIWNKTKEYIKNNGLNPKRVFSNTISNTYNVGNSRYINLYEDDNFAKVFENTSYDAAYTYYKERFANTADFKFFFVGDFDEDKLKEYAEKYIGSLPSEKDREAYKLHPFSRNLKGEEVIVYKGLDEKAKLVVNYSHEAKYDAKESKALVIFGTILKRKLRNRIREEEGGTYGVSTNMGHSARAIPRYWGTISFECDPKKLDALEKDVLEVVEGFLADGPTKEEVESVIKQWDLSRKKNLQKNSFWLNKMKNTIYWKKEINKMFEKDELNKTISHKYVIKTARKYIGKPSLTAKLFPESYNKEAKAK